MANRTGIKWNKGGALSRRKLGRIDYRQFEALAEELQSLGADLQAVMGGALEDAAKDIQAKTDKAMASSNLPAKGKYSTGATQSAIDLDPKVKWSGSSGSIGFGFDFDKPNAGKWLITGTPRMDPDAALAAIYASDKYKTAVVKQIKEALQKEISRLGG